MNESLVRAVSEALREHEPPSHLDYLLPEDEFYCCAEETLNTLVTKLSETDDLKHAVFRNLYGLPGSLDSYPVTEIAATAVYAVLTYLRSPETFDTGH